MIKDKESTYSTISNIRINKDCFKELKKISIDKEITVQEVASIFLEKAMSKRIGKDELVQN